MPGSFMAIAFVMGSIVLAADTPPPPADQAPDEVAVSAALARLGKRDARLHDPSTVVKCNDEYWLFTTGRGVPSFRSKDLRTWTQGPRVWPTPPAWVREAVPQNRRGSDFWAPDIIRVGERYLLYYSISAWGQNHSAIALATNATLDPDDPSYRWVDEGIVVRSTRDDTFNAIDPSPMLDADGRMWMAFGSFWGGIRLIELDPASGRRIASDSPIYPLAYNDTIEAPFLHRRGDDYFLLMNWGWCCRGVDSTYNIRVGRSKSVTGPYLDRDGKTLSGGGGTLLLSTDGPFIGPGQSGLFRDGDRDWLVCHFYDPTHNGHGTLALRPVTWDAEGWPVIGHE